MNVPRILGIDPGLRVTGFGVIELHGKQATRQVWERLNAHAYCLHIMAARKPRVDSVEMLGWKSYIIALPQESEASN